MVMIFVGDPGAMGCRAHPGRTLQPQTNHFRVVGPGEPFSQAWLEGLTGLGCFRLGVW